MNVRGNPVHSGRGRGMSRGAQRGQVMAGRPIPITWGHEAQQQRGKFAENFHLECR